MEQIPKITVITPNFNQGAYIERTIQSVLNQGYPNLEYIIIDGNSTDDSVSIIKKFETQLAYWESKDDNGIYHALNKGFSKATGDIFCWINSDDVLWPGSLDYVASVFSNNDIQWLQGYPSVIDEEDNLIYQRPPVAYKEYFYNKHFESSFFFIQQESTFWTRELWEKAGGKLDESFKLAGDFDLWMRFFKYEKLFCTKKQLAAFRKRDGQKSQDQKTYLQEANRSIKMHRKVTVLENLKSFFKQSSNEEEITYIKDGA